MLRIRFLLFAVLLALGGLIGNYPLAGVPLRASLVGYGQGSNTDRQCDGRTDFLIGSGIYDITGPAAGLGMMGYAQVGQKTGGLHSRLWSRAFAIQSPCSGKRVVFVSADLLAIFQAVKLEVVKRLQTTFPDGRYKEDNVVLSAIHNHAGPGGYSHYKLYNLTIGGFDKQNFEAIVDGICKSITRADNDLAPGTIRIAQGELLNISANRSRSAYLKNPDADPAPGHDTDKRMTLLRFDRADGKEVGMLNWFAVHCTSMHNSNHLISGDNKGFASYLFERVKKSDYDSAHTFVAAFAQANEGDVTPNICGGDNGCGSDDFDSTEISGRKQFEGALALYGSAREYVTGGVDYRHTYVKMDEVNVAGNYTGAGPQTTCPAALGFSMVAGAEDGPGIGWQGLACDKHKFLWFLCKHFTTKCQGAKPIIATTGSKKPYPWSPNVLPLQLVTIGDLAIIAVPAEFTTISGRRLVTTVMNQLASVGVHYAVIAGLSNAYSGYVATPQEYDVQRYEGASTHFGPWTLPAYQQEFDRLAIALRDQTVVGPGPTPLDPIPKDLRVDDSERKPPGKSFGDIQQNAKDAYFPGDTVKVSFWAGHPRNDLKIQNTYLQVLRQNASSWEVVARDRDWEAKLLWRRTLFGSLASVEWHIPITAQAGVYKIRHDGSARSHDGIVSYYGKSKAFRIR